MRCGCGTGFHSATEALWATPREGRISNSIWFESKGALCWSAENTPSPGGGVRWQEEGVTNRKQAIYQCGRGCWKKIMKVIFEPRYTVPPIRAQSSPTEKSSVLSATSEPHDGHRVPWLSGEKRREDELGMKSTLELLGGDHWGTRAPPRPRRKDTALRAPRPGRSRGSAAASRARGPELQWQRQPPAPRPGAGSSPGTGSREAD